MRKKIVMGNWKMNGQLSQVERLLDQLVFVEPLQPDVHCVVLPPSIYLPYVCSRLKESPIGWGAQNVYPKNSGAFTGELSAPMLIDYQCQYVLVGHSERRSIFHEDEKFVAEKFHHVKDHGMIPVLCVGETLAEKESGLTEQALARQLAAVTAFGSDFFNRCVIAYEPVWAIGTGQTATPEQAQYVHTYIRGFVAQYNNDDADLLSILYGGSVNENNARALFSMPDVDGGLIGGASLDARQFVEILKCISYY